MANRRMLAGKFCRTGQNRKRQRLGSSLKSEPEAIVTGFLAGSELEGTAIGFFA